METVLRVITVIALLDLVLVGAIVLGTHLSRRRAEREIRRLEALWRAPPASEPSGAPRARASRLRRSAPPRTVSARRPAAWSLAIALTALAATVIASSLGDRPGRPSVVADADQEGGVTVAAPDRRAADPAARPPTEDVDSVGRSIERGDASTPEDVAPVDAVPEVVAAEPRLWTAIVVQWEPVASAVAYEVERAEPSDDPRVWLQIATTGAHETTLTDRGLESATTYYYRVIAITPAGEGPPSDVISATTAPAPAASTTVRITSTTTTTISLAWDAVADATGYRIERWIGDGESWEAIATTGADVNGYIDANLTPGTDYRYRVVAVRESGDSPPSNVVEARTEEEAASPAPPADGQGGADDVGDDGDAQSEGSEGLGDVDPQRHAA